MKNVKLYTEFLNEEELPNKCENCGSPVGADSDTGNLCAKCEKAGYWIDPAGGVHQGDEEDPAKMYESDDKETQLKKLKETLEMIDDKLKKWTSARQNSIHPFDPQKKVSDYVSYLKQSKSNVMNQIESLNKTNESADSRVVKFSDFK